MHDGYFSFSEKATIKTDWLHLAAFSIQLYPARQHSFILHIVSVLCSHSIYPLSSAQKGAVTLIWGRIDKKMNCGTTSFTVP